MYEFSADLSSQAAVEYLTCVCPEASKEAVTELVKLLGGRFAHLVKAATPLQAGVKVEEIKLELFSLVARELAQLEIKLPPSGADTLAKATWRVAQELLEATTQRLTFTQYAGETSYSKKKAASKIFLMNFREVKFQSTLVQSYIEHLTTTVGEREELTEGE